MNVNVTHNPAASRFETEIDGHLAIVTYFQKNGTLVLDHTEVPDALGGMGVGSQLARTALDYAMTEGIKVVPQCPFIKSYIERHAEYQSLLAD